MSNANDLKASPSYFWSCLTFSEECPFFANFDPNLIYFGVGLLCFYAAFMLVILTDLVLFWPLDNLQSQIDYYINVVRNKVHRVQIDQRRLMSTQERTEKQVKRTEQCQMIVDALRGALAKDDQNELERLTRHIGDFDPSTTRKATWSECHSILDF